MATVIVVAARRATEPPVMVSTLDVVSVSEAGVAVAGLVSPRFVRAVEALAKSDKLLAAFNGV